jgi:hypothetical protein
MIRYSLVLSPYNAEELSDNESITINRFLLSNECKQVTKAEWKASWYHLGWRPVAVYAASSEIPEPGDQVWSKAMAISNYHKGEPIHLFKKIVTQPSELTNLSIERLNKLIGREDLNYKDIKQLLLTIA